MQLLIKVNSSGDDPHYQDGDIVEAFSEERVLRMYAEQLCVGWLREEYLKATSRYVFQRVGSFVERYDQNLGETEVLGVVPNAKGEYINVEQFLARKRELFGSKGSERWYGGNSGASYGAIWDQIEALSASRRANYHDWPLSDTEKRHFLPISCCGTGELSHGTACSRLESIYSGEDNQVILNKRRWRVPYWDLTESLGVSVADVRNSDTIVDLRTIVEDSPQLDQTNQDKLN